MSHKYSVGGYIAKIRFQTRLAVLVEGVSDRNAIVRTLRKPLEAGSLGQEVVVDAVSSIGDFPSSVPGNWQRVEFVANLIENESDPTIMQRFRAFVDRDFRQTEDRGIFADLADCHVTQGITHWTRGHSLENYFLSVDNICNCLSHIYGDRLSDSDIHAVRSSFADVFRSSVCCSFALHRGHLISKSKGLFSIDSWCTNSSGAPTIAADRFVSKLESRGVNPATAKACADDFSRTLQHCSSGDVYVRWTAHGKLVLGAVWTGIGYILSSRLSDAALVEAIAKGHSDEKHRCVTEYWKTHDAHDSNAYPTELVTWAKDANVVSGEV